MMWIMHSIGETTTIIIAIIIIDINFTAEHLSPIEANII